MEVITRFICCSGYGLNNYDDITAYSIVILSTILTNLLKEVESKKKNQTKKDYDDLRERIEMNGIEEENDVLLFHTSRRDFINIKKNALQLKYKLNKQNIIRVGNQLGHLVIGGRNVVFFNEEVNKNVNNENEWQGNDLDENDDFFNRNEKADYELGDDEEEDDDDEDEEE
ncbi:MAG: hypothetical protein EZS28_016259 [Streblomastix strix]|uniref:Uncharacterized protein n=1 Tax=Streblomastix strix TaxID=222440 RepID=A0A5J4W048_9EUKA|nr:MAG: hypothetical protein EZS28_016259 [Streblomastix strix]